MDWVSIIPPLVAILVVFWKKEVIMALLLAVLSAEALILLSVTGDTLALCLWDGAMWVEKLPAGADRTNPANWDRFLHAAQGVHDVVPKTNPYYGLRVERASFNDSNSWDSIRLLTAA